MSSALFARATRVMPGGVNSPVRAFQAVGGEPPVIASGNGPYLVDVDGRRYVDLVASWGPLLLGHAHPSVLAAVREAADAGLGFGAVNTREIALAEEIVARVGPVERLRLVNSGTEATMSALRLARAATGRDLIVKFAGCYHGHVDALLAAAGSGAATFGLPDSPGVTKAVAAGTIVVEYNDIEAVDQVFRERGSEIAAVIVEAAAANMGVVAPEPGFNQTLRELTHRHGSLLILDEVLTGFRVSAMGWYGLEPVPADLFTFGKVMGGGLPAAAFGGRAELMDLLAPVGSVYQAGTLSGNPLAAAAGLATLQGCAESGYERLDWLAEIIGGAASDALSESGVAHRLNRAGNLFSLFFCDREVSNYRAARHTSRNRYSAFFLEMLARGVYLPPSPFEAWFVNTALDDSALEQVLRALPFAARAAAAVPQ